MRKLDETYKQERINDPLNKKIVSYSSFMIFLLFYGSIWIISQDQIKQKNIKVAKEKRETFMKNEVPINSMQLAKYLEYVKWLDTVDTEELAIQYKNKSTTRMSWFVLWKKYDKDLKDTLTLLQKTWERRENWDKHIASGPSKEGKMTRDSMEKAIIEIKEMSKKHLDSQKQLAD